MFVEDLDVVARVFLGGERIELAADGIDLLGDILGGPRGRALEQHVLDKMGHAAPLSGFVTRAAGEPHADADGSHLRHALCQNAKPVIENVSNDR